MKSLAILLVSLGACGAWAAEREGVKMPDQKTVAGKKLTLNGIGMREATMFKVDVYGAGLYLEAPSKDPDAIIASPALKHVDLQFVREVPVKDISEAWSKGIKENCSDACDSDKAHSDKLVSEMQEMKAGDIMSYTFHPGKTEVTVKGKTTTYESPSFGRTLLTVWLGPKPPNEGLKRGMLGDR